MALSASTIWEVETGGSDTANGGAFDPSQTAGMLTDGAATAANTSAPVFTSASYNFVSGGGGDTNAWLYIASSASQAVSAVVAAAGSSYQVGDVLTLSGGTHSATASFTVATLSGSGVATLTLTTSGSYTALPSNPVSVTGGHGSSCTLTVTWTAPWIPGWYQITSVGSNAATLNATAAQAVLKALLPNTATGCSTIASPTAACIWTIDYSQQASAQFTFAHLTSAGTGLTVSGGTSGDSNFGKQMVGNCLVITSVGTNFNLGRYVIASVSGTTATVVGPTNITTGAGSGGGGGLGGALASLGQVGAVWVSGHSAFVQSGTYTLGSASANVAGGTLSVASSIFVSVTGYGTVRGDLGTTPVFKNASFTSINMISQTSGRLYVINLVADGNSKTGTVAFNFNAGNGLAYKCVAQNCAGNGFTNGGAAGRTMCVFCAATNCSVGFNTCVTTACEAYSNASHGFSLCAASFCLSRSNTGAGFASCYGCTSCIAYGNTLQGFTGMQNFYCASCIAEANTGVGFNGDNNAGDLGLLVNCAAYNNTGGATALNLFITPSLINYGATAFVSAAGTNFALNNNNPGGALLRAVGIPGTFPVATTTGFLDIGAAQHQDPAPLVPMSRRFTGF